MKRKGNFIDKIGDYYNVEWADNKARKGKKFKRVIEEHDKNRAIDNFLLGMNLQDGSYKTSEYYTFKIFKPKERLIYRLPYYPDRIAHHAIMNVLEPYWKNILIKQTYSSIKGRGIHLCMLCVKRRLRDRENTKYCLKLDIKKFYPSIDHDILKQIIRRKIKDSVLLKVLDNIIDSAPGVPIGNYLSQYFANLYLYRFDYAIKSKTKYYFRYADDIVILSKDKNELHELLEFIKCELSKLKLEIKSNYLIFPVDSRPIDFVGYVLDHDKVKLRKSIKNNMLKICRLYARKELSKERFMKKISSYKGYCQFCNSKHLLLKIEDITGIHVDAWLGKLGHYSELKHASLVYFNDERIDYIYKNKPKYLSI